MTPDTISPPLPHTLDLSGLPEAVVIEVSRIVALARREQAGLPPPPPLPLPINELLAELGAWRRDAEARAHRYPPGHVIDDSRETIYGERDQL